MRSFFVPYILLDEKFLKSFTLMIFKTFSFPCELLHFPPMRHTMRTHFTREGRFYELYRHRPRRHKHQGRTRERRGRDLKGAFYPDARRSRPRAVAGRIGQVIAQLSIGEDTVGGVGVGCPGTVDDASGIVRFAANLNFVNFDLRSALRAHTALPIHLGNDANAAALGEALFGCGRGAESTIVVTLGTGVGGGVVLGGKLLTGYTGAASEIGHMVIAENGEECTCGSRGCFEAYSSATALIRDTKRTMAAHPESLLHAIAAEQGGVDGRTAFLAKERGDGRARRSWRTTSSIWPAGSQILSTFSSPKCWLSRAA